MSKYVFEPSAADGRRAKILFGIWLGFFPAFVVYKATGGRLVAVLWMVALIASCFVATVLAARDRGWPVLATLVAVLRSRKTKDSGST